MKTKTKIGLLLLVVTIVTSTTITIIHSQQKQSSTSKKQNDIYVGKLPVVDYADLSSPDLKEKPERVERGKNHNIKFNREIDAKRFMIVEKMESSYGFYPEDAPVEPAIPAALSDAIVVGKVSNAQAFLSENKTSIYSEFDVNISEVLKNNSSKSLNDDSKITISRGGGAVRFPSGKVIERLFAPKPMPSVERNYIFFLKYNNEGEYYPIITAYEILDGQIIPLDGKGINGKIPEQLAAHQSYKGTSETDFLNLVQFAIRTAQDLFEREGL